MPFLHPLGPYLSCLPKALREPLAITQTTPTRSARHDAAETADQASGAGATADATADAGAPAATTSYLPSLTDPPKPRAIAPCRCRAGPKSGTCLRWFALVHSIGEVGGVRVTPASAAEVGPSSVELGKQRGPVPSATPSPNPRPKTSEKRAYRRARNRAALHGGTHYGAVGIRQLTSMPLTTLL